jgi:DNA polymerase
MFLMLDFETRSVRSLKTCSYRQYARCRSTRVLCLGVKLWDRPVRVVIPQQGPMFDEEPVPEEIEVALSQRLPIYAHNVAFDSAVYEEQCVRGMGWPEIPADRWFDTMAVCAYYAFPRSLEKAGAAIGLGTQKDKAGSRVLTQVSKPRPYSKRAVQAWVQSGRSVQEMPLRWWEDDERLQRIYAYCGTDVESQAEILKRLGPLPAARTRDWRLSRTINQRGLALDWVSLVSTAEVVANSLSEYNEALRKLTATAAHPGGMAETINQRQRILDWCDLQGYLINSLTKEAVESALSVPGLPEKVRQVLTIRQEAGKSSLGKLETMLEQVDEDGRVRDTLVWHGAATGRMAGRGIQPQNFPRVSLKPEAATAFHDAVTRRYPIPPEVVGEDSLPEVVSKALRSFIVPQKGKRLFVSDFSNIETRNVAWLSGCRLLLEAFSTGKCPYRQFASRIYHIEADSIKKDSRERQMGKVAVLGLGYQMGGAKFVTTAGAPPYSIPLTLDEATSVVKLYRTTYPEIPALWRKYEDAMIQSIQTQTSIQVGAVTFGAHGEWAWIVLPSGRPIWFAKPAVQRDPNPWQPGKTKLSITYMGTDIKTKQWVRRSTYGGSILESVSQGMAADLLTEACHRLEDRSYPVVLTVHDEVVSEADADLPLDPFHQTVKEVPSWCPGMPVECESHVCERYGK